jgi:hypothetical protein
LKVLFVSSGNSKAIDNVSPFIRNQGESLKNIGVDVTYFTVQGKSFSGYLKAALSIRKEIKKNPMN